MQRAENKYDKNSGTFYLSEISEGSGYVCVKIFFQGEGNVVSSDPPKTKKSEPLCILEVTYSSFRCVPLMYLPSDI